MTDGTAATSPDDNVILLRLTDGSQLFNTLNPSPFRERDLSAEAERYIVEWAEELPRDRAIEIVIRLEDGAASGQSAPDLAAAIGYWFDGRAQSETRAMRQLFWDGRLALVIGLVVLAASLSVAWWLSEHQTGSLGRVLQESFVIIGWVVIWRPAEMFLYDWLPMVRQRNLYRRLAAARVSVRTVAADPA